jgi:hypothetical protein
VPYGFHFLDDEGTMAIILPHGVLFRGGTEARIREKLLKDGHIDTVIGLPAKLFFSTKSTPNSFKYALCSSVNFLISLSVFALSSHYL